MIALSSCRKTRNWLIVLLWRYRYGRLIKGQGETAR